MAVPRLLLFSAPPRFKILFPLRIRLFSQRQARLNSPLVKFNLPCRKKKAGDNSKGENSIMLKNPDYYPTPEAVAAKILSCIDVKKLRTASILEPSAGKGDLADALLKARYGSYGLSHDYESERENVHCCESDPELQACLRGKVIRWSAVISFPSGRTKNTISSS